MKKFTSKYVAVLILGILTLAAVKFRLHNYTCAECARSSISPAIALLPPVGPGADTNHCQRNRFRVGGDRCTCTGLDTSPAVTA